MICFCFGMALVCCMVVDGDAIVRKKMLKEMLVVLSFCIFR